MSLLNNVSLSQRLYGASGILIAALLGVAVTAWHRLGDAQSMAQRAASMRLPQLERIASAELDVTRVSLQLRHGMLVKTPADVNTTLTDIAAKRKHIDETLAEFERALFTQAGRDAYAVIKARAAEFSQVAEPNVELIRAGKKDEAFAMLVEKTMPARNKLLEALDSEKKRQGQTLATELQGIDAASAATRNQLVVLTLLTAGALLWMVWSVGRALRERVVRAQAVAERVRDGDLTQAVVDDKRDELTPLLTALHQMQDALTRVVGGVRNNAESVATASAQIAQGNADLSQRTEEQASALQQTASSMEELGSTVRQNADNAKQANQLALGASNVAQKGGEVVSQVVATMSEINASSKKIADIIGVIDGIAFQTNILALNAAVEAARAGEQGRGFAVVAGEVRLLAQRSADAAKEIKALITASVQRVEQGSALVDQAGTTMEEVVAAIRRVTDLVGEISSASSEQSNGIGQIGTAVSQLDQTTQQNAALVEQSAAAADSLSSQARALVQSVATFRLTDSPLASPVTAPTRPVPAARPVTARRAAPAKPPVRAHVSAPAASIPAPKPATQPAPAKAAAVTADAEGEWESF